MRGLRTGPAVACSPVFSRRHEGRVNCPAFLDNVEELPAPLAEQERIRRSPHYEDSTSPCEYIAHVPPRRHVVGADEQNRADELQQEQPPRQPERPTSAPSEPSSSDCLEDEQRHDDHKAEETHAQFLPHIQQAESTQT
jgi:hypothetical protein